MAIASRWYRGRRLHGTIRYGAAAWPAPTQGHPRGNQSGRGCDYPLSVSVCWVRLSLPDAGLGPIERPVTRTGPGSYQVGGDFPLAGEWLVEISVRVSRFDEPIAQIPVEVG